MNFLFVDLGVQGNSTELTHELAARGILVRDCRSFGDRFDRYIRVAVRPPQENARLLQELALVSERG